MHGMPNSAVVGAAGRLPQMDGTPALPIWGGLVPSALCSRPGTKKGRCHANAPADLPDCDWLVQAPPTSESTNVNVSWWPPDRRTHFLNPSDPCSAFSPPALISRALLSFGLFPDSMHCRPLADLSYRITRPPSRTTLRNKT